jgi:hypothetical protein
MANGENQNLTGGRELNYLAQKDSYLGSFLSRVVVAVNQLATNAGVAAVGKTSPPPKIDSIQVQGSLNGGTIVCPSEILHHVLVHNQAVNKGVTYFSEVDTSPNFPNPHVISHGTSRSSFLSLPTYATATAQANAQPTNYYLRSYAQNPGSDPSEPTVLGNIGGETAIQMTPLTGTTGSVTQLLPSTGSGTASPTGQQGGKGLGTVTKRQAPQAKRQLTRL